MSTTNSIPNLSNISRIDAVTLCIPFPLLWKLQVPIRKYVNSSSHMATLTSHRKFVIGLLLSWSLCHRRHPCSYRLDIISQPICIDHQRLGCTRDHCRHRHCQHFHSPTYVPTFILELQSRELPRQFHEAIYQR